MDNRSLILNKLLDKYEARVPTSNRRVRIELAKNEISIPDMESGEYREFREDMLKLKSKGYIDLDWARKDYLIKSIWLVLENADEVYEYLGREKRTEKVGRVVELIDNAMEKISLDWIFKS